MNVGTLTIEIATNVARLQQDMAAAKGAVQTAMRDVESSVAFAKRAFVGLTGITSVGVFAGMINGAIEAKARLFDLSVQTGISVEAIAGLDKVARYSNTALADVAGASNKLSKALFTQNEDSRGAAQAIAALGLNFNQFKLLAPEQQLLAVAKAMEGFQDGTGKAGAAMLLFGKNGAAMLPFLKELAERNIDVGRETTASAKAAKEYEDNLVTLRMAGEEWKRTLAGDMLPTLIRFTQELIEGRKAYGGWAGAIVDQGFNVAPGKSVGENLAEARKELEATQAKAEELAGRGWFARALDALPGRALQNSETLTGMQESVLRSRVDYFKALQAAEALAGGGEDDARFRRAKPTIKLPGDPPERQKDQYDTLIASINAKIAADLLELDTQAKLTDGQKEALAVMEKIRDGTAATTREENAAIARALERRLATEKLVDAQRAEAKWIEEATRENERAADAQAQARDAAQQQAEQMRLQLALYGLTSEEVQALETARLRETAAALRERAAWADADGFLRAQAELYRDQAQALEDTAALRDAIAAKEAVQRNDPLAGADRAVREYLDHVRKAGDATYGAVANALQGLEDLTTQFLTTGKADIRAWVNAVISEMVRLRIVRPLLQDIFGGGSGGLGDIGRLLGALFGLAGGDAGITNAGTGSLVDNGLGGGRASGGSVRAGWFGRVNEQGPELLSVGGRDYLMMGAASGNVSSAGATRQALGGRGVTINQSLVMHVDARSDQAAIAEQTTSLVRSGNRQLLELLHARGVV